MVVTEIIGISISIIGGVTFIIAMLKKIKLKKCKCNSKCNSVDITLDIGKGDISDMEVAVDLDQDGKDDILLNKDGKIEFTNENDISQEQKK